MAWFSRRERRARMRRGKSGREGVFGGEMKTKEEIDALSKKIESHEEVEKAKADKDLEADWEEVEK